MTYDFRKAYSSPSLCDISKVLDQRDVYVISLRAAFTFSLALLLFFSFILNGIQIEMIFVPVPALYLACYIQRKHEISSTSKLKKK